MALARYWTVTTTSVMPWVLSRLRICSMTGRPTIGTIGLGRMIVSGRRREPSPPAMTTAFIVPLSSHQCAVPTATAFSGAGGAERSSQAGDGAHTGGELGHSKGSPACDDLVGCARARAIPVGETNPLDGITGSVYAASGHACSVPRTHRFPPLLIPGSR